jgi:hypothetical protein
MKNLEWMNISSYLHTCKAKCKNKMEMIMERKRRSEQLTKEEVKAFCKYLSTFPTKFDAALAIGVSRPTLNLVIIRGSGHPETIRLIREKLNQGNKAA